MRSSMPMLVALFCSLCSFAQDPSPLAALVGHWEGGGTFLKTSMSEPGSVTSKTDCGWSPQQRYLLCETSVTQGKNNTVQFAIYTPLEGETFRFYRISGNDNAHNGKVTIHGATWVYDDVITNPNNSKKEIRTTNNFNSDEETFKTEFSTDGKTWTTMLEGKLHRVKK